MDLKTIYCFTFMLLFSVSFGSDESEGDGESKNEGKGESKSEDEEKKATSTEIPKQLKEKLDAQLDQGIEFFSSQNKKPDQGVKIPNPGPPPPGFQDKTNDKFQNDCLKATNGYRKKHHGSPLKIDAKLVEFAKARCLLVVKIPSLQNGQNGPDEYGESIFLSSSKDFNDCNKAMDKWYNVGKTYDYKNNANAAGTGQYTQLIWLSTTNVGCALCTGPGKKGLSTYVVCNYSPAGNYQGEYHDNVKKA